MTPTGIIALAVSVLAAGLFSGLMFTLIFLMQLKWDRQTAAEYFTDIQPFLEVGKGNRVIALVLFVGLLAPIPALLGTGDLQTGAVTLLILTGMIIFGLGALGVTVVLNLPTYHAIMSLNPQSPDDSWQTLKQRFFRLNLMRFIASFVALLLFVAAIAIQL
ncbi:MAG: anthrone oxygenase family protein [Anaerolineae bacterium]